jgi:AcrR family transcriptional regulator
MARLTRKEKQAHTRTCLMKSAAKVFAKRGLQHASIDEVAEEAGYTKGAFYANFKNKEELFLAMLDERFGQKLAEVQRVAEGDDFSLTATSDPEFDRLFFEFSAYAARNEDFREELVTRYKALRAHVADAIRGRAEREGVELPVSPDQIALMTFAMAKGLALENMLEPDVVDDELFSRMLAIFFAGLTKSASPA